MGQMVVSTVAEKLKQNERLLYSEHLAVEEPLEIRLGYDNSNGKRIHQSVSITMRTPGNDSELAVGFLYAEGLIRNADEIDEISPCGPQLDNKPFQNIIRVEAKPNLRLNLKRLKRYFLTNSSCGICGKASIEALRLKSPYPHSFKARCRIPKVQERNDPHVSRTPASIARRIH